MKPKEWLHKHGHIETIGKGRMSLAHIALVTEAAKTTFIEGYTRESSVMPDKPKNAVAKPAKSNGTEIVELAAYVYHPDEFEAVYTYEGREYATTTKAACMQHQHSICGHVCLGAVVQSHHGSVTITHYRLIK